ncbi:MAG: insulinase family protein [Myxococcaceae bacterium]|nr:insulinase family protein [Myxococcaceae bacterium]
MSFRHHRTIFPNGLTVVTVETPHLHSAMVAVYVRVGSRHETADNNGVSHFLEHLFFRGSHRHRDTVKMNAQVEAVGGNLNGITTRDCSYYYTPCHPDSVKLCLETLGDLLTSPRLVHLELEKKIILEEMLDEVDEKGRDIDLDNLAKRELYGAHPLAFKIAGTPETVRAMTLAKVKRHFAHHYVAGNMVVAVSGPVAHDEVERTVRRVFAKLPAGPRVGETPPPEPPKGPHLKHVRFDEAQTELRLSFPAVSDAHPDFAALSVLRRVLDDGLSSRLPYNVVERRGLAYSVSAALEAFHDTGVFDVEGACAPEAAGALVREICRTLASLREGEITAEELGRAKRRHRMHLDFLQDSPSDLIGWFGGTELFRPPESFEERCRAVDQVTLADLRRVSRTYLRRTSLRAIAVGPGSGLKTLRAAVERAEGLGG